MSFFPTLCRLLLAEHHSNSFLLSIHSVSTLNFQCVPHQPGELRYPEQRGRNGEDERKATCNPPSMPEHEQREQICTQETQRNATDLHAPTQEVRTNSIGGWFKCETDKNMETFHINISSTGHQCTFQMGSCTVSERISPVLITSRQKYLTTKKILTNTFVRWPD